ncbi:hypothetical protein EUZ85_16075 [Hahella sp. KA22]|uniref:hypothetical protein n=1 Tax=Hahella sp. KA22 TaxID=1628392 RepID=UPI000FDE9B1F|nr:hypothetical protein [Hahella sp. KA22]AZZ92160.1 hypothetical protein ENC22_13510 [Hahella sp. KA22]QAY55531.1 hypothetical protein EUZ85_16075 [Hahella sp. KA22]
MPENLFQKSVNNSETNSFFRGEGAYYSHNPMDGQHCYGVRLSGDVNKFIHSGPGKADEFSYYFKKFVDSLSPTYEDLGHLLANLAEVTRLRRQGLLSGVEIDKQTESDIAVSIKKYFQNLKHQDDSDHLIKLYLGLIERDNSIAVDSILKDYLSGV